MIQQKLKICYKCEKDKVIWKNHNGNKYCRTCWNIYQKTNKDTDIKPAVKIKPVSDKKQKENAAYATMRAVFIKQHPVCQARLSSCTIASTDVHHKKGRGIYTLDTRTWMCVCRSCHNWIELHPVGAKALGFSLNRLNDDIT